MLTQTLTPQIYDAYLAAESKIRKHAPHLLQPLKDALVLALDQHMQIAPPAIPPVPVTITAAFVWSQDEESSEQFQITRDRRAEKAYFCNCPSFQMKQHTHNGRTFCKHMIAAQLFIKAAKAKAQTAPDSINPHMISQIDAHLQPVPA